MRAAINIIGASGNLHEVSPSSLRGIVAARVARGLYTVTGTIGMVPFPPIDSGWGYAINQMDRKADVEIEFADQILTVTVTKNGAPYDLLHMITLHILAPDPEQPAFIDVEEVEVAGLKASDDTVTSE